MTGIAAPDDLAGGGVESSEQAEGSVKRIVVGAPLDLARAHRQKRLCSVQRLDVLALPVDPDDHRVLGRRQIRPDHTAHLLDEQRIG